MDSKKLVDYIKRQIERGIKDEDIRYYLQLKNISDSEIEDAFKVISADRFKNINLQAQPAQVDPKDVISPNSSLQPSILSSESINPKQEINLNATANINIGGSGPVQDIQVTQPQIALQKEGFFKSHLFLIIFLTVLVLIFTGVVTYVYLNQNNIFLN